MRGLENTWIVIEAVLLPRGFQDRPLSMLIKGVFCHDGCTLYLTYPIWQPPQPLALSEGMGGGGRAVPGSVLNNNKEYPAIKRNAFESVLMRWMNLEPIIQSEVSQKEKTKYRILTHVCGI